MAPDARIARPERFTGKMQMRCPPR
jgi:hypothetical protein